MVLITFSVTADLDEVPDGQSREFYALAMQEHIRKTALDDLDYGVMALDGKNRNMLIYTP